ncbi:class I SAM-dependent methyltransferase [Nitrospira sp. M1]
MLIDNLERLIPDQLQPQDVTGGLTLELHMERYEFAAAQSRPGRILDIACGVGYGSKILFEGNSLNKEVLGVDCSEESIKYATKRYAQTGIHFMCTDAMSFQDEYPFDTIVSLETIEHVLQPKQLITHLLKFLRPGGIFIGSVPTTPTVDANPHHLHDFTPQSFRKMFHRHDLTELTCLQQRQPFNPIAVLQRKETRLADLRPNLAHYYYWHPHALFQRCLSILRHGFTNHYLTCVWQKQYETDDRDK